MRSPWKQDFPIFLANAHPHLCYLDSASTCLTPKHVADAMYHHQCYLHANNPRGLFQLNTYLTELLENARHKIADFIGATCHDEVIFTRGTTDALNLIAYSYLEPQLIKAKQLEKPSNIVISAVEHEANILPWQRLAKQYGAEVRVVPINEYGEIDVVRFSSFLDEHTCLVAISHCSNVIGLINPVEQICRIARNKNIITVVDGAQAVSLGDVNVDKLACDFYTFSSHKVYGPTGCGVLFAKKHLIEAMRPYQVGARGYEFSAFKKHEGSPCKFELNSVNLVGVVGLVEAIDYLTDISWSEVNQYLTNLSAYLQERLNLLPYLAPLCPPVTKNKHQKRIMSFSLQGVRCQDVAGLLDHEGIALSAGTHHAQSLHHWLGVESSVRISIGLYNDEADVDHLVSALESAHRMMVV